MSLFSYCSSSSIISVCCCSDGISCSSSCCSAVNSCSSSSNRALISASEKYPKIINIVIIYFVVTELTVVVILV